MRLILSECLADRKQKNKMKNSSNMSEKYTGRQRRMNRKKNWYKIVPIENLLGLFLSLSISSFCLTGAFLYFMRFLHRICLASIKKFLHSCWFRSSRFWSLFYHQTPGNELTTLILCAPDFRKRDENSLRE